MPAGRPTKYQPAFCERVLSFGLEGMSKLEMCHELGIGWDAFQDYQEKYPEFSGAVKEAFQLSQMWWERKGRLATFNSEGLNATMYIFNMKNRFKADWRDKIEQEQSGKVEHDVNIPGLSETAEFLSKLASK